MIVQKVYNTIEKYGLITKGDKVVVGLSGGPDSICLLHILYTLSSQLDIKLTAVHINHMLRGREADQDEEYVKQFCNELSIEIISESINIKDIAVKRGLSLEEAGREARYGQFELIADKIGAAGIAVAHNRNDQAETIIMRLIRGTGLEGLKGIEHKRGRVIRPLLDVSRKEIEAYCAAKNLNPRTDSSNLDNVYTRNKIRLDLIPQINSLFDTDITDILCRMANLLREDSEYIDENAIILYNQCIISKTGKEIQLDIPKLNSLHTAIAGRIIRFAVKEIKGDTKRLESLHVEKVLELAARAKTGTQLHLPSGIRAKVSYGVLTVSSGPAEDSNLKYEKQIEIPGFTEIAEAGLRIEAELLNRNDIEVVVPKQKAFVQIFDFDKLSEGINIRNRRDGDIFSPFRSKGTKKLKEYFIDKKIPKEARNKIPLIAKNNEIVWIIGYKISDKFTVSENTKRILKITYINELK